MQHKYRHVCTRSFTRSVLHDKCDQYPQRCRIDTILVIQETCYMEITGNAYYNRKLTPCDVVRKRTIPTERLPPVGEFLVSTFAYRRVSRGERGGSPRPLISVFQTAAATF
jgi:hypothetical protein